MRDTNWLAYTLKCLSNIHRPGNEPNAFIFSVPRSGSTWLLELIWTQPGFKHCNEPLNMRNPVVRRHIGLNTWDELQNDAVVLPALEKYIDGYCHGQIRFKNPIPFRGYYRPFTSRIVFKVIHGGEMHASWLAERFNGRVVFLIRHPIPVAFSRRLHSRLETYLHTDYASFFDSAQAGFAHRVIERGSHFEKGIVDWCFQNVVLLQKATPDWIVMTYEQLVLDPLTVIGLLATRLMLPEPERMIKRLSVPSKVSVQSDQQTRSYLESHNVYDKRDWLVSKWQDKVTSEQRAFVRDALVVFGIDGVYSAESALPCEKVWISQG